MNKNELKEARQAQIEANPSVTVTVYNKRDDESYKLTIGNVRPSHGETDGFRADVLAIENEEGEMEPYIGDELFIRWNHGFFRAAIFQKGVTGPVGTFPARFVEQVYKAQLAAQEHRQVEAENTAAARAPQGNLDFDDQEVEAPKSKSKTKAKAHVEPLF